MIIDRLGPTTTQRTQIDPYPAFPVPDAMQKLETNHEQ